MDAAQALADLTEISSQIEAAVLFDEKGTVDGSTLGSEGAAQGLVEEAKRLLEAAASFRGEGAEVTQIEASTSEGSVFVVADGPHRIAATTAANPTVGLVFYDLKSCLREAGSPPAKPKPKRSRRAAAAKDEEGSGDA
ncbi:MAG TPA: hypothetical protein VJ986_05080 [Gaiellaceae bacterium]|nr:hypothetical protein [Gaiellaceae bacterium]